jgi:hypothetical protein
MVTNNANFLIRDNICLSTRKGYLDKFRTTRKLYPSTGIISNIPWTISMTKNKRTNHNSDGLINCLLQPRQIRNSIQKSMREEFEPHIKARSTRTVPITETKSIGLQADARGVMVFANHLDSFIMTRQLSSTYRSR